ncbi:GerMN domain-containing protein [Thalassobacillus pellis]|uniref:GerMN domain-containing protein n=1 Tax=Thalassobacillus pellis TaxID=748008 RepID=UPI0019610870|nr:GerMN domain-containing protein [Thalassobacillus pellis]MBM7555041.1 germination protein M [Thalassobacillus pellis]
MKMRVVGPMLIALLSVLLSGCFFEGEQSLEKMDSPQNVEYTEETGEEATKQEAEKDSEKGETNGEEPSDEEGEEVLEGTTKRQLYLLDQNGMVVPQTLELPNISSKEVAEQALEYIVKGGPVTDILPNGFEAVLPAGTQILGLNLLEDGTMVVDVSEEFANYRPEDEQKILQAMTFTLTQFESVDRIKLWINGHEKEVMPVNGTPISDGVSRADGINIHAGDVVDLVDSKAVTLYYPAQNDKQEFYYVPVTTHLKSDEKKSYESIVQALLEGPAFELPLFTAFNKEAEIKGAELKDGVLTLSFNKALLSNEEKQSVSEPVMKSLVMTLTEQDGVDAVEVKVEGVEQVFGENGESYAEPVTRSDVTGVESF